MLKECLTPGTIILYMLAIIIIWGAWGQIAPKKLGQWETSWAHS